MKYKLPSVKSKAHHRERALHRLQLRQSQVFVAPRAVSSLVFVLCLLLAPLAISQETDSTDESRNLESSGQEVVIRAAKQMMLHPSLEAKMRQRVGIRDRYMVGTGAYLQLRHDDDVRFRLELRLQVGEQLTSLQHITDRRYLYIRRDTGDEKSVSRIDLKRVQEAKAAGSSKAAPASLASLGVGGLSQLLHGLAANFEFGEPEEHSISGVNVWQVQGSWKSEVLAKLLPDQSEAINAGSSFDLSKLPPQLPHHVSLVVGRDGSLPLFPYRVEFTKQTNNSDQPQSMLIMELFEVQLRPDLDPRLFQVPDSDNALVDETDAYLRKHGLVSTGNDD